MAARIPKVIQFAYSDLLIDNVKNKWSAKCNHCGETHGNARYGFRFRHLKIHVNNLRCIHLNYFIL